MRHIREIEKLPISELSDEEITKAALHRLNSNAVMLVYNDTSNNRMYFIGRYKKGGSHLLTSLKQAWEERFGKFNKIEEEC